MIDILRILFEDCGYQRKVSEENGLWFWSSKDYSDFWIVAEGKTFNDERAEDIFNMSLQVFDRRKEVEKNLSLLLVKQVDNLTPELTEWIMKQENDPFYFKKYVIVYTDEDLRLMNETLDGRNLIDFILDMGIFNALKEEKLSTRVGKYHLAYSFAHKLPFLRLSMDKNVANLDSNEFIPSEQLKDIYDWVMDLNMNHENEEDNLEEIKKDIIAKVEENGKDIAEKD